MKGRTSCMCSLFEPRVVHFSLHERLKLQRLGQKLQDQASSLFFRRGPLPPLSTLVDTDIIHVPRPSPFIFAYSK